MSAIAFDTLKFARRLKEVGVPEAQAEAQAELMAEAFVFNMDALVTRDFMEQCLDARFAAQENKLLANIEARFDAQDKRIDARFEAQDRHIDARFDAQDKRIEARFDDQDKRIEFHFDEQNKRFELQDQRFEKQDQRFDKQDQRFDKQDQRFDKQDERFVSIEARLRNHDLQFAEIRGELKLHRWMLAIIAASTVIPALQKVFALLAN